MKNPTIVRKLRQMADQWEAEFGDAAVSMAADVQNLIDEMREKRIRCEECGALFTTEKNKRTRRFCSCHCSATHNARNRPRRRDGKWRQK